jgi:hypothetical protein
MKGYLSQISNFEESELFKNLSETIKNFRKLLAHYNDTKTKKNKFLHIKYNKSYEYDKKNKDMNKTFGVYVVYDSMRRLDNIDILPPIYGEPGVNFDLANLIYFLKANGYKNIYIYDLSCNFSDKINRESNELLGSPVTSSSDVAMEI